MDGGGEGRVHPAPLTDHWTELFGSHFRKHRAFGQGHKANGQGSCFWVTVKANAATQGRLKLSEVKVGMIDKDSEGFWTPF